MTVIITFIPSNINSGGIAVMYNIHIKFELYRMHRLDNSTLLVI